MASAAARAAEFYVSPTGTSSGNGSPAAPWSLAAALAHPPAVRPGDTIWLRGGTYRGVFTGNLNGSPGAAIKIRQYPGERATLDGGNSGGAAILTVSGSYTWYWGFEIMSSTLNRTTTQTGSVPTDRGGGLITAQTPGTGAGLKFINLIIHDASAGIALWKETIGPEVYGCLIYHNGWVAPDRPHGHGIYLQNQNATARIADNLIFNQFSHGVHAYGSAAAFLDNIELDGNTIFNNGLPLDPARNILIGGDSVAHNITIRNNALYYRTFGQNLNVGYDPYGAGVTNGFVSGNYVANGTTYFSALNSNVTVTSNTFFTALSGSTRTQFPSNLYYASRPTGVHVVTRANAFEPGRGHVTVFNWDGLSTVSLNLSSILPMGAQYEIRNAQNYFGTPVASGTFNGAPVSVSAGALVPPRGLSE